MDRTELLQEAARRGILPANKQGMYDEAVKRGLIEDRRVSALSDAGLSALSAVPKAISGLVGFPKDAGQALGRATGYGIDRLMGYSPEEIINRQQKAEQRSAELASPLEPPGSGDVRSVIESVTGPLHEPETRAGKFADTTTQMVTGSMLAGVGSVLPRFVQGAVPGLVSEAVGQTPGVEGTRLEPWARGVSAVLSGGASAAVTAPKSAGRVVSEAMQGVTTQQMNDAMRSMSASRKQGGVPLTWPEAIQKVTGGTTTLDDVSRLVEQSPKGGPIMRKFYADRPEATTAAVNTQLNRIDASPTAPELVGPEVRQAAQGHLDRVNSGINDATRPLYDAAKGVQVFPTQFQQINTPAFQKIVKEVRSDPFLGRTYANTADDSVEMLDAVKKWLDKYGAASKKSDSATQRFSGAIAASEKSNVVNTAKMMSQEYDDALRMQADLRKRHLEPLVNGPTGALSQTDDLTRQIGELFPANPLPNSEHGVSKAIQILAKKDPRLAANVVGTHLERVFNETAQKLTSGHNQAGGARFAAILAGNTQQSRNLEAAIRALPNGASKWAGFKQLLTNLEATGTRKAQNSATSINEMIKSNLKGGSIPGQIASTALSPQRALSIVKDTYEMWRIGRNTQDLARLFTDPTAGRQLARLAMLKPGSPEAIAATARVLLITQATGNGIVSPDRNGRQ